MHFYYQYFVTNIPGTTVKREPDKRGNKFQMIHCYKSSPDEKQFPFCSITQKYLR